jgi:hypothetical protein
MTDAQMWALVVGALLPPLIAVAERPTFPSWARAAIALVVSAVAGFVTVWIAGDLNGKSVTSAILLTLIAAVSSYESLWRPTGIAPRVELATSPRRDRAIQPPPGGPPTLGTPNPMPRGTTSP